MPHISSKLAPGRPAAQKQRLAAHLVQDMTEIAGAEVFVAMEAVPPADWTGRGYKPEIRPR